MKHDFTEHRADYTGDNEAPELTITVGVSGCGKSTWAKSEVFKSRGGIIRINRDDLRMMSYCGCDFSMQDENLTKAIQEEYARQALRRGINVIIDDTNCIRQTRQKWEEFAFRQRVRFRAVHFTTDLKTCIERDKARGGTCATCGKPNGAMVGEGIIRKQHKDLGSAYTYGEADKRLKPVKLTRAYFERTDLLKNGGFMPRLANAKWVLVDMDGTTADHYGVRGPFEEHRVLEDKVWENVAEEVRRLYPQYNICIVSGRHDDCGDDTCDWLEMHGIPYDHILMRYHNDNRSDDIVKQEILNELIDVLGKENIAFVIDDRPRVVRMWKSNGILVRQVFKGEFLEEKDAYTKHADDCPNTKSKGYRRCEHCGALEDY